MIRLCSGAISNLSFDVGERAELADCSLARNPSDHVRFTNLPLFGSTSILGANSRDPIACAKGPSSVRVISERSHLPEPIPKIISPKWSKPKEVKVQELGK